MFGSSPRNGANAYSQVSMETGVLAANPHKLIVLLFDGAIMAVSNAIQQMNAGKIPEKGRSISHAIAIVDQGLRASLNKKVGGELAVNLDTLYGYMIRQLMTANLYNQVEKLAEVQKLLRELKGAWDAIAPDQPVAEEPVLVAQQDALAPRKFNFVAA